MLTNAAAKAAQPGPRAAKLFDGGGLFLFVAPTGLKSWRLKYRFGGKEKLLTIGRFPDVGLPEARLAREAAKAKLRDGIDPAGSGRTSGDSFEDLARDWHAHSKANWSAEHAVQVMTSLERDVFPAIGGEALSSIDSARLLELLRAVEKRGCIATARRLRHRISAVFQFGIAAGVATADPAQHLVAAMRAQPLPKPMAALTTAADCRALLAAADHVAGAGKMVAHASRFLALTAVRLDAVRGMRWREVHELDGDAPVWIVPPERMKMGLLKKGSDRFAHHVPLSPAAADLLRSCRADLHSTDAYLHDRLVFPGRGGRAPIGEGAIRQLYALAGYAKQHVPHGWRASFSTIMNEQLGPEWRDDIDRALAHTSRDKVEAAYNRALQLERRRRLFATWAELLSERPESRSLPPRQ